MEQSTEKLNLADLPLEILEVISGYLSIQDLLACSACSRRMRDVFNDNSVWRPRCDKELCEYLKTAPCKVEPHFNAPKIDHSSLNPISAWKVEFMRQNHLWNNWRQGRKMEEVIHSPSSTQPMSTHCWVRDDSLSHFFLTSDCILAVYPYRIEFIDVSQTSFTKAASDIELPASLRNQGPKVMACGNFVIIICKSNVQVYQIDLSSKQSMLKHVFFIGETQKVSDVQDVSEISDLIMRSNQKNLYMAEMVGNLLIGVLNRESRLHIWNIESGEKIKMQDCPVKDTSIFDLKISRGKMNLIICAEDNLGSCMTYLSYNLTTFTFLPFQETFGGRSRFCCIEKYIAIWNHEVLNVYDYTVAKQLLINHPIDPKSNCQVFISNFVFLHDSMIKIFFPSSQKLSVFSIVLRPGMQSYVLNKVGWFEVLNDKFIQVSGNFSKMRNILGTTSSLPIFEVVNNLGLAKTSLDFWFNSCSFFLNKTATRYIVRSGSGNVIHLW